MRTVTNEMRALTTMSQEQLMSAARDHGAPYELIRDVASTGKLPVVNFAAGGIATPADAALMMSLGVDGVFVGSGIFKSSSPEAYARAIVEATTFWNEPEVVAKVSRGLGEAMPGIALDTLSDTERLAGRGW
jgi:pyridoxal 5'-phosphate synthase pdxS subunit